MTLDVTVSSSLQTIQIISESSPTFEIQLDTPSIELFSEGVQGPPGTGAETLLSRIEELEENTVLTNNINW